MRWGPRGRRRGTGGGRFFARGREARGGAGRGGGVCRSARGGGGGGGAAGEGAVKRGRAERWKGGRWGRLTLGVLLLIPVAAAAGCKPKAADPASRPTGADSAQAQGSTVTLPVVGEAVRKGDLILSIVTTAQVRSEAMSVLKSETQGTITEVLVRPGQRVRRGQALLQVDPRPLDLAVKDAEARLDQARLKLLDNTVPDSIVTGKAISGERLKNAEIRDRKSV